MRNFVLAFILATTSLMSTSVVSAQAQVKLNGPEIAIDKDVHDYGKIKQNGDGVCYFTITNTGSEPLIITKAKGSCGCTVPKPPSEAIAPGKSYKMSVKYDTKRIGKINKSVTITSNASNAPSKVIRIKGEILAL